MEGAVAVVTGAGRGLGAALAITLAEHGCRTVLCGRDAAKLEVVADAVRRRGGLSPATVELDLADASSIGRTAAAIAAAVPSLDILVNNGAAWLQARGTDYEAAEVMAVVNAAITGTFLLTQALLPLLKASPRPDVVTVGSISGLVNTPLQTASVPFYAAKHGQAALAEGLRQMLRGSPVRSILVHPPYLDDASPLDPSWTAAAHRAKGEKATTRDVVDAILFAVTRPRHVTLSVVIDADDGGL